MENLFGVQMGEEFSRVSLPKNNRFAALKTRQKKHKWKRFVLPLKKLFFCLQAVSFREFFFFVKPELVHKESGQSLEAYHSSFIS